MGCLVCGHRNDHRDTESENEWDARGKNNNTWEMWLQEPETVLSRGCVNPLDLDCALSSLCADCASSSVPPFRTVSGLANAPPRQQPND